MRTKQNAAAGLAICAAGFVCLFLAGYAGFWVIGAGMLVALSTRQVMVCDGCGASPPATKTIEAPIVVGRQ
jgi:hypothetical protein